MAKLVRIFQSSLALLTIVAFAGCATIITGGEQKVNIGSDPSEASIKITDSSGMTVFSSQTPAIAVLKKGDGYFKGASYKVRIEKQGYKPQEVTLNSSLNAGWYLVGNIILGGLIGWLIVDPLTGGMWTLSPDKVNANLASGAAFLKQRDGLMIVLLEDLPSSLVPSLEKVSLPN
jgi:hypothetical protein